MKRIFILSMCLLLYSVGYSGDFSVEVSKPKFKSKVALSGTGITGITASTGTFAVVGGTGGIGSTITIPCNDNEFYISVVSLVDIHTNQGGMTDGLNGLQFYVTYDKTIVEPNNYTPSGLTTSDYQMGSVVNNNGQVGTPVLYDVSPSGNATEGKLYVGISYQNNSFTNGMIGAGTIISIKFKMLNSAAVPNASFPANTIGVEGIFGTHTSNASHFTASNATNTLDLTASTAPSVAHLRLWQDAANFAAGNPAEPITNNGVVGDPKTEVYLSNGGSCVMSTSTVVSSGVDANGDILLPHTGTNSKMVIKRDIPNTNDVFTVISSTDGIKVSEMIVGITPYDIFMLIAADVNGDGVVSEGDKTDIFLRSIHTATATNSLEEWRNGVSDWKFVSSAHLADPDFILSPTGNASIINVPSVSECIDITTSTVAGCTSYNDEAITAVLIGDISNSWKTANNVAARGTSGDKLLEFGLEANSKHSGLDMSRSSEGIYRMALSLTDLATSTSAMVIDLNYLSQNVSIDAITSNVPGLTLVSSDDKMGRAIISAGQINNLPTCDCGTAGVSPAINELIYIDIKTDNNYIPQVSDFIGTKTYLDEVETNPDWDICDVFIKTKDVTALSNVKVYPNPISDWVTIDYSAENQAIEVIQLFDIQGKLLKDIPVSNTGESRVNTADLAGGIYIIRINNTFSQKVVKMN